MEMVESCALIASSHNYAVVCTKSDFWMPKKGKIRSRGMEKVAANTKAFFPKKNRL